MPVLLISPLSGFVIDIRATPMLASVQMCSVLLQYEEYKTCMIKYLLFS